MKGFYIKNLNRLFIVFLLCAFLSAAVATAMLGEAAIFMSAAFFLVLFLFSRVTIKRPRLWLLGAVLCAFLLRLLWVIFAEIEPFSDFATYHNLAKSIASGEGGVRGSVYISLFPHVLGTAAVFAPFYLIFGPTPLCAQIVNAALAGAAAYLIYLIGKKTGGEKVGISAVWIWAFSPGAIMHSEMVAGEMPFLALMLISVLLILKSVDKRKGPFFALAAGLTAALAGAVRPLGILIVIAGLIFLPLAAKGTKKQLAIRAVALAAAYFAAAFAISVTVEGLTALPGSGMGAGYSLYVGANEKAFGKWNEEDASKLNNLAFEKGLPAREVHKTLAEEALNRYREMGAGVFLHLIRKFAEMWSNDYTYAAYIDPEFAKPCLRWLSNGWYLAVLGYALWGAVKKGDEGLLPKLLILGGAAMHLVTEVMSRYNFPFVALIMVLAGAALAGREREALKEGALNPSQSFR